MINCQSLHSHVTSTVMWGSHSYLTGSDPKTENNLFLNLKVLSTETSPMSHVTATVMWGSHSYLIGSDPKTEKTFS